MSDQDVLRAQFEQFRDDKTRGDWAVQRIEDYVSTILAAAPPLTAEQRSRLAELLRPVRVHPGVGEAGAL